MGRSKAVVSRHDKLNLHILADQRPVNSVGRRFPLVWDSPWADGQCHVTRAGELLTLAYRAGEPVIPLFQR